METNQCNVKGDHPINAYQRQIIWKFDLFSRRLCTEKFRDITGDNRSTVSGDYSRYFLLELQSKYCATVIMQFCCAMIICALEELSQLATPQRYTFIYFSNQRWYVSILSIRYFKTFANQSSFTSDERS